MHRRNRAITRTKKTRATLLTTLAMIMVLASSLSSVALADPPVVPEVPVDVPEDPVGDVVDEVEDTVDDVIGSNSDSTESEPATDSGTGAFQDSGSTPAISPSGGFTAVRGSGEDRLSAAPAGGGTLPFTGDSLWVVFLIGFAMVAVGAVMYVLSIAQLRSMRLTMVLRGVRHIDRGVFGVFR